MDSCNRHINKFTALVIVKDVVSLVAVKKRLLLVSILQNFIFK